MPNYFKNRKYSLSISDDKGKESIFSILKCNIPGIEIGDIPRNSPFKTVMISGTEVIENPLVFTVILDEEFNNYMYFREWTESFTPKYSFNESTVSYNDGIKDISVSLFKNDGTKTIEFKYSGCRAKSISDIDLDSDLNDDTDYIAYDVTVNFEQCKIVRFNND